MNLIMAVNCFSEYIVLPLRLVKAEYTDWDVNLFSHIVKCWTPKMHKDFCDMLHNLKIVWFHIHQFNSFCVQSMYLMIGIIFLKKYN